MIGFQAAACRLQALIQFLRLSDDRYQYENGALKATFNGALQKQRDALGQQILKDINAKIEADAKEKIIVEGKIASPERSAELTKLNNDITALDKIKVKLISGLEDAMRSRQKQQQLYEEYIKERQDT